GDTDRALSVWELYQDAALRPDISNLPDIPASLQLALGEETSAVQNTLRSLSDHIVLLYAVLPDGIAIWIYEQGRLSLVRVPEDPGQVALMAEHLQELCAKPSSDMGNFKAASQALYRTLIAPVADKLRPNRTVLIETGEALAGVPFH